jgi:group I intron endonuclease
MPTCGIYEIKNTVNGRVYFGSSCDIERRIATHRRDLRLGKHHNVHLQRAWCLYRPEVFVFQCVEVCPPEDRIQRECHYILTNAGNVYNAMDPMGLGVARRGQRNTPEHNARIGAANRGRKTWNTGGTNTWAWKARDTQVSNFSWLIEAEHKQGQKLHFCSVREAARALSCSRKSVSNILNGWTKITTSGWIFKRVQK